MAKVEANQADMTTMEKRLSTMEKRLSSVDQDRFAAYKANILTDLLRKAQKDLWNAKRRRKTFAKDAAGPSTGLVSGHVTRQLSRFAKSLERADLEFLHVDTKYLKDIHDVSGVSQSLMHLKTSANHCSSYPIAMKLPTRAPSASRNFSSILKD